MPAPAPAYQTNKSLGTGQAQISAMSEQQPSEGRVAHGPHLLCQNCLTMLARTSGMDSGNPIQVGGMSEQSEILLLWICSVYTGHTLFYPIA